MTLFSGKNPCSSDFPVEFKKGFENHKLNLIHFLSFVGPAVSKDRYLESYAHKTETFFTLNTEAGYDWIFSILVQKGYMNFITLLSLYYITFIMNLQ